MTHIKMAFMSQNFTTGEINQGTYNFMQQSSGNYMLALPGFNCNPGRAAGSHFHTV
jgi:hypothetical protein